ncbi:hypothetical protein FGO68_gene13910 [Halteria grandinella]|uniref:Transmembrane protein n=1 Tax=Halteria grandinella TaxID=5974 RepID=A0A8J8NJY5_HALGN|nr:hypothetical protein FGO68_gene13910 [Halteria grandinella]
MSQSDTTTVTKRKVGQKSEYDKLETSDEVNITTSGGAEEPELELTDRQIEKRKWVRRLNFVNDRGQALCWLLFAAFIVYKTNFFRELWENPHRVMFFFDLSLIGFGINISVMLYMTVYLPLVRGVPGESLDLEKECPQLIPVITICGIVSFFCMIFALWPIWGFLTPIIMFILFMGATMSMIFLPPGMLGTLVFWSIIIFLATASHLIPHEAVDGDHQVVHSAN